MTIKTFKGANTETVKEKTNDVVIEELETDYLVVGAGAMGMSFVDELVSSGNKSLTVILIDERSEAGGHWHSAYPFVRLHKSSLTYGVNSLPLSCLDSSSKERNDGLSSREEIIIHFREALNNFIRTGRVRWFPKCRYNHNNKPIFVHSFYPIVGDPNGRRVVYKVKIRRKLVDAAFTTAGIVSERLPNFAVEKPGDLGVRIVPINDLENLGRNVQNISSKDKMAVPSRYVIIGNGKTGIDAILYLIDKCGVPPENISWIISRDCWLLDRPMSHPKMIPQFILALRDAVMDKNTKTINDFYLAGETNGLFLRLDKTIMPTICRFATIDIDELHKVQSVGNMIRKGRIQKIEKNGTVIFASKETLTLREIVACGSKDMMNGDENAAAPTAKPEGVLFVDCSVNTLKFADFEPIWQGGNTIKLQFTQFPPPGASASMIAALEFALPEDERRKNSFFEHLADSRFAPTKPARLLYGFYYSQILQEKAASILGSGFQIHRRNYPIHHLSRFEFLKLVFYKVFQRKSAKEDFRNKMEQLLNLNDDGNNKSNDNDDKAHNNGTAIIMKGPVSITLGIAFLAIVLHKLMTKK